MLGQYTFGLKQIAYGDIVNAGKYFGNAVGGKSSASDAGYIDLKAGKQMYSLKARFNIFALEDVLPVCAKAKVTITPTVTTAGTATLKLKVAGTEYSISLTSSESTAAKVVDAIKTAVANDEKWVCTGTSTAIFEQREGFAYTYDADDWSGTVTGTGVYSTSAAKTQDYASKGVTFLLQHSADGSTFTDLVSSKVDCSSLKASGTPCYEITMPSNCDRYVRLKVTADTDATAGTLLCAIEPHN